MNRIACALALSLAVIPAYAADAPKCTTLEKLQKEAGENTTFTALTPAQYHFMQGMYVANPRTPEGLPPGDGALLLTLDNADVGMVVWTRGTLVCSPMPLSKPKALMKMLGNLKAGADGDDM